MGLLATISALVLGLMVASAKGTYDAQKNDVVAAAAKFVILVCWLATLSHRQQTAPPLPRSWFPRYRRPGRFS